MARPKKDSSAERLSAFVIFQCRPSEKAEVQSRAKRAGLNLSEFMRIVTLSDLKAPTGEARNLSAIRDLTVRVAELGERITAASKEGKAAELEQAAETVKEMMLEITRL